MPANLYAFGSSLVLVIATFGSCGFGSPSLHAILEVADCRHPNLFPIHLVSMGRSAVSESWIALSGNISW